jgi:methylated-DNA-[protein]-cysteine S-methyltransferase
MNVRGHERINDVSQRTRRPAGPHRGRQPGRAAHAGSHRQRLDRCLPGCRPAPASAGTLRRSPGPFAEVTRQLGEYFSGERTAFELQLALAGTAFQQRVWDELRAIPYGQTISYGALARRIGQPTASRAVGLANGKNPVAIIVPCHRVVGADGSLAGYGGGLDRKRFLIALEQQVIGQETGSGQLA